MKRKITAISIIITAVVIIIAFSHSVFEYTEKNQNIIQDIEKDFFGDEIYSELQIECTADDREAIQPVLDFADKAFSYLGDGDKYELFGELGKYCYNDYTGNTHITSERHNIYFLTAKLNDETGYLWVEYFHEGHSESNEFTTIRDRKSRWTLEKTDGKWVVSDILEHP